MIRGKDKIHLGQKNPCSKYLNLSTGFVGKKKENGFKQSFMERINKLDPYCELFHAINKLEHSRNLLDRQIHISYNQHSPRSLEQKRFVQLYIRPRVSFLIHRWGTLGHIEYILYMYHKSLLNVTLDLYIFERHKFSVQ